MPDEEKMQDVKTKRKGIDGLTDRGILLKAAGKGGGLDVMEGRGGRGRLNE